MYTLLLQISMNVRSLTRVIRDVSTMPAASAVPAMKGLLSSRVTPLIVMVRKLLENLVDWITKLFTLFK